MSDTDRTDVAARIVQELNRFSVAGIVAKLWVGKTGSPRPVRVYVRANKIDAGYVSILQKGTTVSVVNDLRGSRARAIGCVVLAVVDGGDVEAAAREGGLDTPSPIEDIMADAAAAHEPFTVTHEWNNVGSPPIDGSVGRFIRVPDRGMCKVVAQRRQYIAEDGDSFGLSGDSGWFVHLTCRLATDEEAKPFREAEKAQRESGELLRTATLRWREIVFTIATEGDKPDRVEPRPVGDELKLEDRHDADAIILAADGIWLVVYNGRDGDRWVLNNLDGHSIARRAWPFSEVADELRALHRAILEAGAAYRIATSTANSLSVL